MGKGSRPEHTAPPEVFYNEEEAVKYTNNSRIMAIQESLTNRAVELLMLPDDGTPRMLLDIGCGSGLSGELLTSSGNLWLGMDISQAMLEVAADREVEGDLMLNDMGQGLPLRSGGFDGAISISAVQWLCNADKAGQDVRKRLRRFFRSLYAALAQGARAVLQFYPENTEQAEMIVTSAMSVGFSGGLVVDYPHSTRAKKYFLVLMIGSRYTAPAARGLDGSEPSADEVRVGGRQGNKRRKKGAAGGKSRGWVLDKKDRMRHKGYDNIPADSKYTARKRKRAF